GHAKARGGPGRGVIGQVGRLEDDGEQRQWAGALLGEELTGHSAEARILGDLIALPNADEDTLPPADDDVVVREVKRHSGRRLHSVPIAYGRMHSGGQTVGLRRCRGSPGALRELGHLVRPPPESSPMAGLPARPRLVLRQKRRRKPRRGSIMKTFRISSTRDSAIAQL